MSTITITGTVKDSAGASGSYSVVVTLDSFTLSAVVTPAVAPLGTTRFLTVTPTGGIAPFTYATPVSSGITFSPVSGQTNQWSFIF